jgi:toxin ParE1/3/4
LRLRWLPKAMASRDAQIDYIAQDNPKAAIEQGERIEQQISRLIDYPEIGRRGRVKGTRELVIVDTPYIAVYRVRGETVQVLRVLHGAQQWPPPRHTKA